MNTEIQDSVCLLPYQMGFAKQQMVTMVYDEVRLEKLILKLSQMFGKEAVQKSIKKVLGE